MVVWRRINRDKEHRRVKTEVSPRLMHGNLKLILYLLVATLVLVSLVLIILDNRPVINKSAIKGTNFPVYLPKKIPEGYQLGEESISATSNVVSYTLANRETNNSITITVQPMPGQFSMSQLAEGGQVKSYQISSGTLYDLTTEGSYKYILDTGDTLVFFRSKKPTDLDTIRYIAENLTRQK